MNHDKIIGILGGMGPQASAALYDSVICKCIEQFDAKTNADFPHLLISNLPVPDLISDQKAEEETVRYIREEVLRLEKAGVTDMFIACNTIHLYQEKLFEGVAAKFHSIIDMVMKKVQETNASKVFIMGTNTTLQTGLYQKAFEAQAIDYVLPSDALREALVQAILNFIKGRPEDTDVQKLINQIKEEQTQSGADVTLLGCTELPLVFKNIADFQRISTLDILAEGICGIYYRK